MTEFVMLDEIFQEIFVRMPTDPKQREELFGRLALSYRALVELVEAVNPALLSVSQWPGSPVQKLLAALEQIRGDEK